MKKYNKRLFLVGFFLVSLLPQTSFAISGACSSHGGVNCSAGPSLSVNAICNDGYESSTNFYLTDECQATNASYQFCAPPIKNGCSTESDYGVVSYHVAMQEVVSGWPDDLATCRSEINNYQAQLTTYNACVSANATAQQQSIQNKTQALTKGLQQAEDAVCQKPHGIYSYYDSAKNVCACQTGYEVDPINSQCELPAVAYPNKVIACTNALGASSHLRQFTVGLTNQYQCGCDDGFVVGTSGKCVDARPVRLITQQALDWAQSNQSCRSDTSLSADEMSQCVIYESNPDKFHWQISNPQSQAPTDTTNTTPTDDMTSLGQAIASETQAVKCTNADYPYLGYDGICHKAPNVAVGSLTAAQIAKLRASAGLSPIPPTAPASASTSSWQSQIKSKFDETTTAATTTENVASSTPASAPKQKHWYEWLNPLNWFSWLH